MKETDKAWLAGIIDGEGCISLFRRHTYYVPSVKVGLDCLRNYRREYDEKRKVFYDRPLHDWSSHGADAFRYLAIGLDESSKWGSSINKPPKWIV